jgi:hypothetical protein
MPYVEGLVIQRSMGRLDWMGSKSVIWSRRSEISNDEVQAKWPLPPYGCRHRPVTDTVSKVPGELSKPIVPASWDRCRSPREVLGPKVDCDGRQAQSYADPENRRMMDRSSVARSWLHSITSSSRANSEVGTARPSAFRVLRIDHQLPYADCRTAKSTPTRPAWREDVRTRRRLLIRTFLVDQA